MELSIYARCNSRKMPDELLTNLHAGWFSTIEALKKIGVGEIVELDEIEVTLLDDSEMARVHGKYLNDATTTDVITFPHGELLIGVEVAARQAEEFGTSADMEIALYGIHGMLHLAGFDDHSQSDFEKMAARQEELLRECFA